MPCKTLITGIIASMALLLASNSFATSGFVTNNTPLWTTTGTSTTSSVTTDAVQVTSTTTTTLRSSNSSIQTATTSSQTACTPAETPVNQLARYGYDELDRLTSVDYEDGTSISYAYGKTGNRTAKSTTVGGSTNTTGIFSITASSSGFGTISPSGTIAVLSGSSQTFFLEQGGKECLAGFQFVPSRNRCEKSPPECPSGGYSYSTYNHQCEVPVINSYPATCSAGQGTLNGQSGMCEYSANPPTVSKLYSPPLGPNGNSLTTYDDMRDPNWMCGYLVNAYPDSRITAISSYSAGAYDCYSVDEVSLPDGTSTRTCDLRHNGNWGSVDCLNSGQNYCADGVKNIACNITGTPSLAYSCPNGGTLSGTVCQNNPCSSGGTLNGSTCYINSTGYATPVCTSSTLDAPVDVCFITLPGTLTHLYDNNVEITPVTSLPSEQGGFMPRYYYTLGGISGNHTITATFTDAAAAPCTNYPSQIAGTMPTGYLTLQSAYNAAGNGNTIQGNIYDHFESLLLDRSVAVTIDGGYSCDYSTRSGSLTVKGDLTIASGSLNISGTLVLTTP